LAAQGDKLLRKCFLIFVLTATLIAAGSALAEKFTKTLRSPATVKGLIGGESHDSYAIHARAGQTMTVWISWKPEHDGELGDNHAEFFVSDSPEFGGDVTFGRASDDGKNWTGKVPKTGNYYIYVMGHPWAHYILKVAVK
jgi:hypothetical protein